MFVVKTSTLVSATQTGALKAHVGPVLHNYVAIVMKWCETDPNMSFGSNGVDLMRLLRKTQKWFLLHKLMH